MVFKECIDIYSDNHMETTKTLYRRNASSFNVKASGVNSYHWNSKGLKSTKRLKILTMVCIQNYSIYGHFPSSDMKTKAKRLKLLRFESGFCSCLQVNNKLGGFRSNKPNQLGAFE
jgi:hypothetical protein